MELLIAQIEEDYLLDDLDQTLDGLKEEDYKEYVNHLALEIGPRPHGSSGNLEASRWIQKTIVEESGGKVGNQLLGSYQSILSHLPAIDPNAPAVVFSAHFDSVPGSPGADDDGSGTALLLFLAKTLSNLDFRLNIHVYFAFCNAEEIGLFGSAELANYLSASSVNVLVNINFDMVLYGSPIFYWQEEMSRGRYWGESVMAVSQNFNEGLIQSEQSSPYWAYSDHYSFYSKGFAATTVFESKIDSNPYYHSAADLPDAKGYNYTYPVALAKSCILAVVDWSQMSARSNLQYMHFGEEDKKDSYYFVVADNSYLGNFEMVCAGRDDCRLSFENLDTSTINLVTGSSWQELELDLGLYKVSLENVAEFSLVFGPDENGNNYIDYVEELYFDLMYDPVDLQTTITPKHTTTASHSTSTSQEPPTDDTQTTTSYTDPLELTEEKSSNVRGFTAVSFLLLAGVATLNLVRFKKRT